MQALDYRQHPASFSKKLEEEAYPRAESHKAKPERASGQGDCQMPSGLPALLGHEMRNKDNA